MRFYLIQAAVLSALLAGLPACSPRESQRSLIQKVAQADRVIVLNSHNGLTKTLNGEELKKIFRAIESSVRVDPEGLSASPGYTLIFFTGGVHLATVPTAGVTFWFDGMPHEDKSGAIQSLSGLGLQ